MDFKNEDSLPDSAKGKPRGCTTICDQIEANAVLFPDEVAVVSGELRLTHRALRDRVFACSNELLARQLVAGERVGMVGLPNHQFWILFLATLKVGGIWVGINPKYRAPEIEHVLSDCQPRLLFADDDWLTSDVAAEVTAGTAADSLSQPPISTKTIASLGGSFNDAAALPTADAQAKQDRHRLTIDSTDPAMIVYTSGSSGAPKGAVISHRGLFDGALMQASHFGIAKQSMVVNFPINHVACVADTCATTLVAGGKIVFQEKFSPEAILQAIDDEQCTVLAGVPTMLHAVLDEARRTRSNTSSLRLILSGGAALAEDDAIALQQLAPRLLSLYGMTETSANIAFVDSLRGINSLTTRIGHIDPAVDYRIADEQDQVITDHQVGELQLRSPLLFLGYWRQSEATSAAWTSDGWFKTGDLAFEDEHGLLAIRGRRSEMFKSGGYNVYPREVENALERHPDVALSAVIAVPDPVYQEVGVGWVVAEANAAIDEDALLEFCKTQLANYKVPKKILIVDALPTLPVGKVDKRQLQRRYLDNEPKRTTNIEGTS